MVPLRIVKDDISAENAVFPTMVEPAAEVREFLNRLRWVTRRCRASARLDLFHACAVLSTDRDVADTAHAEVLMKGLSQALGKMPVFFRPGVQDISFDEAWLLRIFDAMSRDDDPSLLFLLRSRVHPAACRNLSYLIRSVSERFSR